MLHLLLLTAAPRQTTTTCTTIPPWAPALELQRLRGELQRYLKHQAIWIVTAGTSIVITLRRHFSTRMSTGAWPARGTLSRTIHPRRFRSSSRKERSILNPSSPSPSPSGPAVFLGAGNQCKWVNGQCAARTHDPGSGRGLLHWPSAGSLFDHRAQ